MKKAVLPFVVYGAIVSAFVGCNSSDMPLVRVAGKVTFDGGPCPAKGQVLFVPVPGSGVEGLPIRPGTGAFGRDGKFVVSSFNEGDGLLPGRYRVKVVCMDGEPSPSRPRDQISYVPTGYAPEELVVEEGKGSINLNYDVPPK